MRQKFDICWVWGWGWRSIFFDGNAYGIAKPVSTWPRCHP